MSRTFAATLCSFAYLLVAAHPVGAVVSFHPLFNDGTVLQRDKPVEIYGTADPGEDVTVDFDVQQKQTTADGSGNWSVTLDPMPAGGPLTLSATGTNQVSVSDVHVGEVWLCAGQSNMLKGLVPPEVVAAEPDVRWRRFTFFVDNPGEVCWLFGVRLHEALDVPVLLINIARGGSKIRSWLPPHVVPNAEDPKVDTLLQSYGEWGQWYEDVEFVQRYALRGVAWWQGESDLRRARDHQHLLPALIRSWRDDWGISDLPFVMMQLPSGKGLALGKRARRLPRKAHRTHQAADMRQAFFKTQREYADAWMVLNSDLRGGRHPSRKLRPLYTQRIVNAALANVYGFSIPWTGPLFESMTAEGSALRLAFRASTATGLKAFGELPLQGFALSPDGENWEWADSITIEGEEVVVSSSVVPVPAYVRYGWGKRTNFANLFNEHNLPASVFAAQLP